MARRLITVVLGALAAVALMSVPAFADGDPASDLLLAQNVFYPYQPPVSAPLQRALDREVAAAHRAGLPIKVALIGGPIDLGALPELFGHPQPYARFLEHEIDFQSPQPLLVVMYAGSGVAAIHVAPSVVAQLPRPVGRSSNALARAATLAVARLADASGHPVPAPAVAPAGVAPGAAGGGPGKTVPLVVALVVGACVLAAGVLTARRRRVRAPARRRPGPGSRPRR